MASDEERIKIEKQLSKIYLDIADYYKRMSKVKDAHTFAILQRGIDMLLKEASEVRIKLYEAQRAMLEDWKKGKA